MPAISLLCLLLFWLSWAAGSGAAAQLTPQLAAQRWETAGKPYDQVTAFIPARSAIPESDLASIFLSVDKSMTDAGVSADDHPWLYCASAVTDGTLAVGETSTQVELTLIKGDFFSIHPMRLISGWYLSEDDIMHDRIVLDRQTAWNLFYSADCAGMYVELDGTQYVVAAVVDYEDGKATREARGDVCRAYVFKDSQSSFADTGYTTFEAVLPQPVKRFAMTTLQTALKEQVPEGLITVDNTSRFSIPSRWTVLSHFGTRGIQTSRVYYPYWENAAQLVENKLALLLIPEGLLLLFPAVCLVWLLVFLNRRRTWGLHSIGDGISWLIDRRNIRAYEKQGGRKWLEEPPNTPDPSEEEALLPYDRALEETGHPEQTKPDAAPQEE